MKIRHTVIFTFYDGTTREQIDDLIGRLDALGNWLEKNAEVTDWVVAEHIKDTAKPGRAHLLQDGIFPNIEALNMHSSSEAHDHVVELSSKICDWMAVDTGVSD